MWKILAIWMVMVCCSSVAAQDGWKTHTVINDPILQVRCKYREKTALTEADWFQIEFENRSDNPIHIKDAEYEIRFKRYTREGRQTASGWLVRGKSDELFEGVLDPMLGQGGILPAKTIRVQSGHPSDKASPTGLNHWMNMVNQRAELWLVLHLELSDGRKLRTSADGIHCELEISLIGDAELKQGIERVKNIFQSPTTDDRMSGVLSALLNVDGIAKGISKVELFEGISQIRSFPAACGTAINHYREKYPVDWNKYQKELRRAEQIANRQLPWNPNEAALMVQLYESHSLYRPSCLAILWEHRQEWEQDKKLSSRLSTTIRREYWMLNRKLEHLTVEEKGHWVSGAYLLAKSCDRDMIRFIRPGLDDTTVIRKLNGFADWDFGNPPPPRRVCDETLHALYIALDVDIKKAYQNKGYTIFRYRPGKESELDALRDDMIADMKKKLNGLVK